MILRVYAHASRENAWEVAEKAGLTGEALRMASHLGSEVELAYDVNKDGVGTLVAIDGMCLRDTNGDGNCGRKLCPFCSAEKYRI